MSAFFFLYLDVSGLVFPVEGVLLSCGGAGDGRQTGPCHAGVRCEVLVQTELVSSATSFDVVLPLVELGKEERAGETAVQGCGASL